MSIWKSYMILEVFGDGTDEPDCELGNEVNKWLRLGWQPLGGVAVSPLSSDRTLVADDGGMIYAQALVHAAEDAPYPGD